MEGNLAKGVDIYPSFAANAHKQDSVMGGQGVLLDHHKDLSGTEKTDNRSVSESYRARPSKTVLDLRKTGASAEEDDKLLPNNHSMYWSSLPPTVSSMLGGYSEISRVDLRGSATFVAKLFRKHPPKRSAPSPVVGVDCGAGIGRVAAGFLSRICDVVDVVEMVESLASAVKRQEMKGKGKIGTIFVEDLKVWTPELGKYDIIWNQWCAPYLTDTQLVEYFKRCASRVKRPDGWICVKENTTSTEQEVYDPVDDSVTRPNTRFLKIFQAAGLNILAVEIQKGLPQGLSLFPVRMYALRPLSER